MHIIVTETTQRRGKYHAQLCEPTRQPLLDGARELLGRGVDPQTPLVMRRAGSAH